MLTKPYSAEQLQAKRARLVSKYPLRPRLPQIFIPHVPDIEFLPIETKEENQKKRYVYKPAIPQDDWDALRSAIMVRDELKCQDCNRTDSVLSVHHIDCDKTNNDPDNLVSLCWPCHTERHQKIFWARNSREIHPQEFELR